MLQISNLLFHKFINILQRMNESRGRLNKDVGYERDIFDND